MPVLSGFWKFYTRILFIFRFGIEYISVFFVFSVHFCFSFPAWNAHSDRFFSWFRNKTLYHPFSKRLFFCLPLFSLISSIYNILISYKHILWSWDSNFIRCTFLASRIHSFNMIYPLLTYFLFLWMKTKWVCKFIFSYHCQSNSWI